MPRPRLGTPAERQARYLARQAARTETMRAALERIAIADTVEDARQIAASIVGKNNSVTDEIGVASRDDCR